MSTFLSLAQLFATTGPITGRKKLQKIVHILQECTSANFGVSFSLSLYGAFSSDLSQTVETLEEEKLLCSTQKTVGLEEFPTRDYRASDIMLRAIKLLNKDEQVPRWAALAAELNQKETRELEALSTVIYFKRAGWEGEEVKKRFFEKKPHLKGYYDKAEKDASVLMAAKTNY